MKKVLKLMAACFYIVLVRAQQIYLQRRGRLFCAKTLLIVRIDAIGDYILFRNCLQAIAESSEYRGYRLVLCGNAAWRSLAERYDAGFIDEFIWLDKSKFVKDLVYTLRICARLWRLGCEVAVQPAYSREFGDLCLLAAGAQRSIAVDGDTVNASKLQLGLFAKKFCLLPAVPHTLFEYERNREFMHNFVPSASLPGCPTMLRAVQAADGNDYAVLFPGGSSMDRCWPVARFAAVARYIVARHGCKVVIAAAPQQIFLLDELARFAADMDMERLVTDLARLAGRLAGAKFLVSNETMAVHMAANLNVPYVCVSNGSSFGRFHPYPKEMGITGRYVYPPGFSPEDAMKVGGVRAGSSSRSIAEVQVPEVLDVVERLMQSG